MKAILVIEMPDDVDIDKVRIGGDGNIYFMRDGEKASIVGNIRNIKPMPQRIEQGYPTDDYTIGKADGWNACLKEITGETE